MAEEFARVRADTLSARVRRDSLRDDVTAMRSRMRAKLDKSGRDRFDLKHGVGGIGDIEFLVQYLVLQNASQHPSVFFYSDNIRQLDALAAAGCIDNAISERLQDVYKAYRLRLHHLVLDEQKPLIATSEFAREREFVSDVWQQTFTAASS